QSLTVFYRELSYGMMCHRGSLPWRQARQIFPKHRQRIQRPYPHHPIYFIVITYQENTMKPRHFVSLVVSLSLLLVLGAPLLAQAEVEDEPPHVQVSEQGVVDGRVNIIRAIAPGPAWIVIHADADGRPGPVIGHAALEEGENLDVVVEVDVDAVTP